MTYPFDPAPATLWVLAREDKLASCEVSFVPNGVQARVTRNGKLLYSRVFASGDETLEWAEGEPNEHLAKGWIAST